MNDGGYYKDADVEAFIRKFGYADKNAKPDRLNFGGRHVVGVRFPPTGLTMRLAWPALLIPGAADVRPLHLIPGGGLSRLTSAATVRGLAQGTDSLRLLRAFAAGAMYYDPGIKLAVLAHGHQPPRRRRRARSEASSAWRRKTSPRSTKRWRRWRCEALAKKERKDETGG